MWLKPIYMQIIFFFYKCVLYNVYIKQQMNKKKYLKKNELHVRIYTDKPFNYDYTYLLGFFVLFYYSNQTLPEVLPG